MKFDQVKWRGFNELISNEKNKTNYLTYSSINIFYNVQWHNNLNREREKKEEENIAKYSLKLSIYKSLRDAFILL